MLEYKISTYTYIFILYFIFYILFYTYIYFAYFKMKKCPSNKIYNPRSKICIANNKTNVQKIIKECSEAYAKLQNKSKPAPKPAPKPKPKPAPKPAPKPVPKPAPKPVPKPAKKNNVCKINTKTKRCSKSGTADPQKCEVAPSGKCRIKKTGSKPKPKPAYEGFQKYIYNLKTSDILKAFKPISKNGITLKTTLKKYKITGKYLAEYYDEPRKLSDHLKSILPVIVDKHVGSYTIITPYLIRGLLKDLESSYVCNPKESELSAKEKIVAKITHEKLYSSIAIKINSIKDNLKVKEEWRTLLYFIKEHSITGAHLVKCNSYQDFVKKIKLTKFAMDNFPQKSYKLLKDHVYGLFEEDKHEKGETKTGNKKEALLVLNDVQKYIKAKDLDNAKSFKYFEGNRITIFAFLLSLLKRHKNDCVVINLYDNNDIPSATDGGGRFSNMKGLIKRVKECAKRKKFAIIPFALGSKGGNHANVIIYNPFTDTFEHFEPHGRKLSRIDENTYISLEIKFRKKFEGTITRNTKYYPPMDTACLLPPGSDVGLQLESKLAGDLQGEELAIYKYAMTDPGGYCVAYSMYIADQRLANPEMRPEEVYLKAIQDASGQSYTVKKIYPRKMIYKREIISFIRQYARTYLEVMRDCMGIFSEYTLMDNRWEDLTTTEKNIYYKLYDELFENIRIKLLFHSG